MADNLTPQEKEQQAQIDADKAHIKVDDKSALIIDPKNFSLPTMGDFYLGYIDGVFLKMVDKQANTKPEGKEDDKDAAFYAESPAVKEMGHENGVYYLEANASISDDDIDQGFADGRTLNISIDDISGDEKAVKELKEQLAATMQGFGSIEDKAAGNTYLSLRLVGIGCPATPKWAFEYDYKNSMLRKDTKKVSEVKNNGQYIFVNGLHDDEEELNFVRIADKWREATFYDQGSETSSFRWLMDRGDSAYDAARKAAKNLQALLNKNGNKIYFLMDEGAISRDSSMSAASMGGATSDASIMGELSYSVSKAPAGCAYKTGYARTHQEAFRRFSGVAYVKNEGKFLNLAKMALTDSSNEELYPDNSYDGKQKELFQVDRYDKEKAKYADSYFDAISALDDRKAIQKAIFGEEWKKMHEWTVTIGDVTLFIPPTSITVVSKIINESQPMLRAKGSASKGGNRVMRNLQMEIYFNEERGINGYHHEVELPNNAKLDYYMNGLRQLVAQFKFTPFLPIENDYINETLGIDAVLFDSIEISNVPNFPKLYKAVVTMSEFDYSAYMPEIFAFGQDINYEGNLFSASINWQVMRYYYQRCIRKGDTLAKSGYKFNSQNYNRMLAGNRTTLVPMAFKSSSMDFYLADKNYMDDMLAARMEMMNGTAKPVIDFTPDELTAMKKLGTLSKAIKEAAGSEEFLAALKDANTNSDGEVKLLFRRSATQNMADNLSIPGTLQNDKYPEVTPGQIVGSGIAYISSSEEHKTSSTNSRDKDKNFDYYINKPIGVMRDHVNAVNETLGGQGYLVDDVKVAFFYENVDDGFEVSMGITISVGTDYLSVDDNFQDLKQDASNYVGVQRDEFFKDYKLFIPLKAKFNNAGICTGNGFELDKNAADMKFLEFCEKAEELDKESKDIKKRRSGVDLKALNDLNYQKVELGGEIYIQSFTANLINHVSANTISNTSGTSAQYLGGEDTTFNILIRTTSRKAAKNIIMLPKIAAQYARDYHMILPYYPLRVDSELTKFLGVSEVLIEAAQMDTSNDATGVYTIQLSLRSVDRTMRDREAMEKTEIDNSGYNRGQSRTKNQLKTFFQVKDVLNQVELYPDLELPTLKELDKVGYDFVRYKFQDGRKYVDPDFYFVYPQVLTSQIIRELVVNGMSNGFGNISMTDKTGASIDITPAEGKGFAISNSNDEYKQQREDIDNAKKVEEEQKKKKHVENLRDINPPILLAGEKEQWVVCDDITPMFLESKYRLEYEAFEAYCKNKGVDVAEEAARDVNAVNKDIEESKKQAQSQAKEEKKKEEQPKSKEGDKSKKDDKKEKPADDKAKKAIDNAKEGQWVANKMQDAVQAAQKIKKYLEENPITVAVAEEKNEAQIREEAIDKAVTNAVESGGDPSKNKSTNGDDPIRSAALAFVEIAEIKAFLEGINIKVTDTKFQDVLKDIAYAAACAGSAEKEYAGKKNQKDWMPNAMYKAKLVRNDGQGLSGSDVAQSTSEAIEKGVKFGVFGIRMYSRSELLSLTKEEVPDKKGDSVNGSLYLLDPYYRSDPERIEEYKKGCINSSEYATHAFMRNVLYWLTKLVEDKVFPSITNDILRNTVRNEMKIQVKQVEHGVGDNSPATQALNSNIDFFNKRTYAIDAGKIFTGVVMALTDGNRTVYENLKTSNYRALNAYVQSCSNPKTIVHAGENSVMPTRKLVLALVGSERIKDMSAIGVSQASPATDCYRKTMERMYIAAAEDPNQFIPHSCHDMVVNDARGRMLRAFPTFYMCFIDEGREIGQWRLHDNFYTTSALLSMQIVKARKLAADTAIISLSNFYQTYTTESDDYMEQRASEKADKAFTFGGAFDSIWSPNEFAQKMEAKRSAMPKQVKMRIREGARLHIRLGYGASADMLPVVFNGSIAEVSAEDTVEIIAQGDGIELMNPIVDIEEAHEALVEEWDIVHNAATTKQIMTGLLTRKGGMISEAVKDTKFEGLIDCNPYGIYHFGSRSTHNDAKESWGIHKNGEITQNIFDSWDTPIWGDYEETDKDTPKINVQVFQKNVWDVANICRSVMPDFVCGVAPFGFRSTLFIGAPRYYYAYNYDKMGNSMVERRKPFEQYHIYTSYSDIIANGIKASSRKMKTAALGLYEVDFGTGSIQKKLDNPVYADIDIYPENQKTMIVDTRLFAKSIPMVSGVLAPLADLVDDYLGFGDTKGSYVNNEKMCRQMTTSALVDSMRDMYCGEMIVLGDPSVKPWDRLYINDAYEGFKGQVTVKEVVHSFNGQDGFITNISPDAIIKADDKFEPVINAAMNQIGSVARALIGVGIYNAMAATFRHVPSVGSLFGGIKDSELGKKVGEKIADAKETAGKYASNAASKATEHLPESVANKAGKAKDSVKAGAKGVKDITTKGKKWMQAGKAILAGTGGGLVLVAVETMVSYCVTSAVSSFVEEKLKNLNAVKVYPLERFCVPYTAGIGGSKGLVISEHAPKGVGGIKAALANLMDNPVVDMLSWMLLSDDANAMMEKFKRDNGMINSDGKPTSNSAIYGQKYLHAASYSMDEKDYRAMQVTPRINLGKAWKYAGQSGEEMNEEQQKERDALANDIQDAFNRYAMLESKNWFADPKLQNNALVSDDVRLKPYMDEQFFYILQEQPTLNKQAGTVTTQVITTTSGEEDYVKAIVSQDGNGGQIVDVAMLHPDALNVLYEIVRRAKNRMPAAKASDQVEAYEKTKGSYVVLKSALRIGDTSSYASTGFSFILQGTEQAYDKIIEAAEELTKEIDEDYQSSGGVTNEGIFTYVYGADQGISNNEVLFTVYMPKVTTNSAGEDTSGE